MNYNDGNWHGWNGGECPVHPESMVECWTNAGVFNWAPAKMFNWHSSDPVHGKIAFRVTKEHKEPREFWVSYGNDGSASLIGSPIDNFHAKPAEIIHVREVLE